MVLSGHNCYNWNSFAALFSEHSSSADFWKELYEFRDDVLNFIFDTYSQSEIEISTGSFGQLNIADMLQGFTKTDINISSDSYFDANKEKISKCFDEFLGNNEIYRKMAESSDLPGVYYFLYVLLFVNCPLSEELFCILPLKFHSRADIIMDRNTANEIRAVSAPETLKTVAAGYRSYAYLKDNELHCYYFDDGKEIIYRGKESGELITDFAVSDYGALFFTLVPESGETRVYFPNSENINISPIINASSVSVNEYRQYAVLKYDGTIESELYGSDGMKDIISFSLAENLIIGIDKNHRMILSDEDVALRFNDKSFLNTDVRKAMIYNDDLFVLTVEGALMQYSEDKKILLRKDVSDFGFGPDGLVILTENRDLHSGNELISADVREFDASYSMVIYKTFGKGDEIFWAKKV